MQLPLADFAVVDPVKVRDYLLSPSHPVGRHKARFFGALGYWRARWEVLARDIRRLARHGVVAEQLRSSYGRKYRVGGMLRGPTGREEWVETIWIVRPGDPRAHLVTVYPGAPR